MKMYTENPSKITMEVINALLIPIIKLFKTQTEFYKYIRVTPKENADKLRQFVLHSSSLGILFFG